MKRVYFKKGKSMLRQRTLSQLRDLQAKIAAENPGLLESLREKLPPGIETGAIPAMAQSMPIDCKKNLHTVMKFMEIKKGSPAFNAKLRHILSEDRI